MAVFCFCLCVLRGMRDCDVTSKKKSHTIQEPVALSGPNCSFSCWAALFSTDSTNLPTIEFLRLSPRLLVPLPFVNNGTLNECSTWAMRSSSKVARRSVASCLSACVPRTFSNAANDVVDQMISYTRQHYRVRRNY